MPRRITFRSLTDYLSSFRLLILLMVSGALLLTALTFMFFTDREVTRAMLEAGDEQARNVLDVVKLNIDSQYRELESFHRYSLERYERQSKNLVAVVTGQIDFYHDLSLRGTLSEAEAKKLALESVGRLRYGNNDYFFIYDARNIAVAHADRSMLGRDMSRTRDVNGVPILKTLWGKARQQGEGSVTMWWMRLGESKPVPKLLYYSHYRPWNWLVMTGVYIDDVDADTRRRKAEILNLLKKTFAGVKVAETGYYFVFDGQGKILIHPYLADTDGSHLKDIARGTYHLDDLRKASEHPNVPWKYLWSKPGVPNQKDFVKFSHVERFAPMDWYVGSSVYEDEMERPAGKIIRRQAVFIVIVVLLCLLGTYILVSRVTRPLAALTRHARRLQETDFAVSSEGTHQLYDISFPREVGHLARTIGDMEQRLGEYLKNLEETTAARERMQSELRIAHDIQMGMLPKALPDVDRVDLAARLEPARDVGGDLYDFFLIDEDHLCLVVGDVSDKGVHAALFMARSKALLRQEARGQDRTPEQVLDLVNRELREGNDLCMFVTVFLGILDLKTGELVYTNAGHLPPAHVGERGCRLLELPPGRPLGITRKGGYGTLSMFLKAGECLVIFTDGITEAVDRQQEMFGDARLLTLLEETQSLPTAEGVVETVFSEINHFAEGVPQADDIAVLCLRWRGPAGTASGPYRQEMSPLDDVIHNDRLGT